MTIPLDIIIEGAQKRRWVGDIVTLHRFRADHGPLSKRDVARLVTTATTFIDDGLAYAAADLLFAGIVLNDTAVQAEVQRIGTFRLSRRQYIGGATSVAARVLHEALERLGHSSSGYMRSIVNLHRVAKGARLDYKGIVDWLSSEREAGVKGALATLDWVFLKRTYSEGSAGSDWALPLAQQYGPEHLAEGFSTILAIYHDRFRRLRDNATINAVAAARGDYVGALITGARLAEFRDWELQVDRMGFGFDASEGGTFRVRAPSIAFQRAIEMGLMHATAQRMLKPLNDVMPEDQSFVSFGQQLTKECGNQFVKRVEDPVARYRLEIPEDVLKLLKNIGQLMKEEQLALGNACRDYVATAEEVLDFELGEGMRMRDLFLISRMLQVMRCVWAEALVRESERDFEAVMQSMVPTLQRANLLTAMGLAVNDRAASAVISLMQTDLSGHVDIQYRPLVPVGPGGELVMMPLNVFADSNVYRNALVVSQRRLHEDGQFDPLSDGLHRIFSERGFKARKNGSFTWQGTSGEFDVLTVIDDVVLVLECKHSLLPTSSHEMLTSMDYIRKAAKQLNRFAEHFQDVGFRKYLAKQSGIELPATPVLVTGIIMSNRMLIGWRENGHAVRGMYELLQFVTEGTGSIGEESKSFWLGTGLCGEDLRRFFQDDITYIDQWKCLEALMIRHEFPGCAVETERLGLNLLKLAKEYGFTKVEAALTKMLSEAEAASESESGSAGSSGRTPESAEQRP